MVSELVVVGALVDPFLPLGSDVVSVLSFEHPFHQKSGSIVVRIKAKASRQEVSGDARPVYVAKKVHHCLSTGMRRPVVQGVADMSIPAKDVPGVQVKPVLQELVCAGGPSSSSRGATGSLPQVRDTQCV